LTDEKKKVSKETKSEEQNDVDDTQNASSSSGLQSSRSKKSVFRTLTARSSQSKTDRIDESSTTSGLDVSPVRPATKALSVTARWGLRRRSANTWSSSTAGHITTSTNDQLSASKTSDDPRNDEQVACQLTEKSVLKSRGKKVGKKDRAVKLYESLDANVLRDALVSKKDRQSNAEDNSSQRGHGERDLPNLTPAASDQDLSHVTHPDVTPLDLHNEFGSRRSSLKLVCLLYTRINSAV